MSQGRDFGDGSPAGRNEGLTLLLQLQQLLIRVKHFMRSLNDFVDRGGLRASRLHNERERGGKGEAFECALRRETRSQAPSGCPTHVVNC